MMAAYACVCAGCAGATYSGKLHFGGLLASESPMADETGLWPLPGDDAFEGGPSLGARDATVLNGGGNGVGSSRLAVTQFNIATEGSPDAGVNNLLYSQKWGSGIGASAALLTSFSTAASAYSYADTATSSVLVFNASQIAAAWGAMSAVAAVANITFTETTDSASNAGDIRWGQSASGGVSTAQAYLPGTSAASGDIWFGPNYPSQYGNPVVGTYGYVTYLHELGHALGLKHPHEQGFYSVFLPEPGEDNLKFSVMSYRDHAGDALDGYGSSFFPTTLMLNDILALQYLYGVNTTHNAGNDVYGWDAADSVFETIWDAAGNDTIDASNQTQGVSINLNQATWSSIGKAFSNEQAMVRDALTIAYGTVIENAIGSAFADTLTGNAVDNTLDGLGGADSLYGGGGNDSLYGGNDADMLSGGQGNDLLDGQAGTDWVSYSVASGAVTVNLAGATATGADGTDTLTGMENIVGSGFADSLTGDSNNNWLEGLAGNDTLNGGGGWDAADYWSASGAVVVNLLAGTATGAAGNDAFNSIENASGSAFNDWLGGDGSDNILYGQAGLDTLDGGGGNDWLYGGLHADVFRFSASGNGVDTVADLAAGDAIQAAASLAAGAVTAGNGSAVTDYGVQVSSTGGVTALWIDTNNTPGADVQVNLEGTFTASQFTVVNHGNGTSSVVLNTPQTLIGTSGNDMIVGGIANDSLYGGKGNDTLHGGAGDDLLNGEDGSDTVFYSDATASVAVNLETGAATGGAGTDTLSGIENVVGSDFNDILTGNSVVNWLSGGGGSDSLYGAKGNDTLRGGAGDDHLYGGKYSTWADYADSSASVSVDLLAGTAVGGAGSDSLNSIDNISGSNFNDVIVGSGVSNQLFGGQGNDTILGGAGSDFMSGGPGDDALDGGADGGTAAYSDATAGVTVSLVSGVATGGSGTDTLTSIGSVYGSVHADTIAGDTSANLLAGDGGDDSLSGAMGADTLRGGGGNDSLNGGDGVDTASFVSATTGVTVDLVTGTTAGGDGSDVLLSIENVQGSGYDDAISGDGGANYLDGNVANDILTGAGGDDTLYGNYGNDTMTGGAGADTFLFDPFADSVSIADTIKDFAAEDSISIKTNLTIGTASSGDGTAVSGMNVQVSSSGGVTTLWIDTNNVAGPEVQVKLNGTFAASQFAIASKGDGTSAIRLTSNTQTGTSGNDVLVGTPGDDSLYGGTGQDTLRGGQGNDYLNGEDGWDTASYADATSTVVVNLVAGTASGGAGSDTLVSIEYVTGSAKDDHLSGDGALNVLSGGEGNDTISGLAETDFLSGDAGNDSLNGGAGFDELDGGAGDDTLDGAADGARANYDFSLSAVKATLK
jgi:Ca2+-binding RTX toxin-like protein